MSITPGRRGRYVFAGDSITFQSWMAGYQTSLTASYNTVYSSYTPQTYSPGCFATNGVRYDSRIGAGATYINSGVSGNKASDIDSAWATRIGAYSPTVLVLLIGINDVILATDPAAFSVSYDSIVTKTQAAFPSCQIACCTLLVLGEKWPTGANANDATTGGVEDLCTRIRTVATNRSCELVDFRQTVYAVQEPIYNPGNATGGVLYDTSGPSGAGLHPNATGQGLMCAQLLSQTVLP